jgi:hypothetical protein
VETVCFRLVLVNAGQFMLNLYIRIIACFQHRCFFKLFTLLQIPTNNMSVRIVEEKLVTPMTCSRCKHDWNYSGKNTYVATCPFCRTKLSISKNRREILQSDSTSGERANQSAESPNGFDSNG